MYLDFQEVVSQAFQEPRGFLELVRQGSRDFRDDQGFLVLQPLAFQGSRVSRVFLDLAGVVDLALLQRINKPFQAIIR